MEIVLEIAGENYPKVKDVLLKDDIASLASIKFREEGGKYYCYISGLEEQCKRALELVKDKEGKEIAKKLSDKDGEKIINKFKEEEDKAMEGFGGIFG